MYGSSTQLRRKGANLLLSEISIKKVKYLMNLKGILKSCMLLYVELNLRHHMPMSI